MSTFMMKPLMQQERQLETIGGGKITKHTMHTKSTHTAGKKAIVIRLSLCSSWPRYNSKRGAREFSQCNCGKLSLIGEANASMLE